MRKRISILAVVAIITGLCAWSPWLTHRTASELAEKQFNDAWNEVIDGCGTSGTNLGINEYRKIPFGAVVTLDYQCGLVMPDEPPLHTTIYVSSVGIAFGFPRP